MGLIAKYFARLDRKKRKIIAFAIAKRCKLAISLESRVHRKDTTNEEMSFRRGSVWRIAISTIWIPRNVCNSYIRLEAEGASV